MWVWASAFFRRAASPRSLIPMESIRCSSMSVRRAQRYERGTSWFGTPREKFLSAMQSLDSAIAAPLPNSDYAGLTIEGYDGLALIYAT